ncbi:type II secretion system protein GspK [Azospirillum griseum]|uniref:General secretion pathway protein K n=1 Tax=Azospirillum griseum TaxID=2496639 RepID=A0A3S0KVX9_9PROT|nr:type II secretion system protein GspK [Azospirillum griseum]RTR16767.1 hypothetical protein EJ903_20045 [Azospirillum griseum]
MTVAASGDETTRDHAAQPDRRQGGQRQGDRRQGGFALVLVLGTLVLIAALALALAQTSRLEVRRTANMAAAAKARALLDAGVALAVFDADRPLRARRFRPAGPPVRVALGDATLDIRLFEEWGRVDLNRSNPLLLRGLIAAAGEDGDTARAIADTVAARRGDTMATRAREDDQPRRPFLSVAELAGVPGVTPDLMRRLWDEVTVDGGPGRLSVATAGPMTLAALPNLSAADRAAVIALAAGWRSDGADGVADPGLAERAAAAGVELDPEGGLPIVGRTLTVRVRAAQDGAEALAEAVVVLSDIRSPVPYRVVEWRTPPRL